ncbi:xanthine dehydrogenase small subunit [Curvivirga sp.]|uniref:xanthine dehydrogenase small subunit n=1 Tax=Curvivirga sp. TaxID=2856848 RepID=UPI003B5A44F6
MTPLQFVFRGELREIADIDPTYSVLRWLREEEGAVGTKEGCAEGDCGACTVVLAELLPDGSLDYKALNACIQFMPMLHGKWLLTVEDLQALQADGSLHPVQQAMVDTSASQCGFCTPGIVMSLFALYRNEDRPNVNRVNDCLAGNLCRCTGYGPIIDAAQKMYDGSEREGFTPAEANAISLLKLIPFDQGMSVSDGERHFFAPASSDELAGLYEKYPNATLVAGATDVGLWVTKMQRVLEPVIYLGRVRDLREIKDDGANLIIGAGTTYTEAHQVIAEQYPDFGELIRRIGSTQVRNAGTIGGNVANGSPIGDTPPALIAADAKVLLQKGSDIRELPLEDFFIEYGKQDRFESEFVKAIKLPKRASDVIFRSYKISKRFDQDISAACGAFALKLGDGIVKDIRICFGGMAGTPARSKKAETALIGQNWSEENVEKAMQMMEGDYTPMTDMRATADYRMMVAKNLLMKFYLETTDSHIETRVVGEKELAHV